MNGNFSHCQVCDGAHDSDKCPSVEALRAVHCSPLRVSYSLAEIEERLKKWMVDEFGHPRDYLTEPEQKDKWYRDYGLIYHFMRDQFPLNVKVEARGK